VSASSNPHLWALIEAYRSQTGLPVVLNTSFNRANEPIVCSPQDAVRTFTTCGLDALVIDHHIVRKISNV
jgi:carbamoyltransferase